MSATEMPDCTCHPDHDGTSHEASCHFWKWVQGKSTKPAPKPTFTALIDENTPDFLRRLDGLPLGPASVVLADEYKRLAHVAAQDQAAVRALVDALPRCSGGDVADDLTVTSCRRPATGFEEIGGDRDLLCVSHAGDSDYEELPYADALRALLDRMKGWK